MPRDPSDRPRVITHPPIVYALAIGAGFLLQQFWPLSVTNLPLRAPAGLGLIVLGFVVSLWSIVEFVRHRTHPDPYRPTSVVIVRGPYRISRNPIYVAYTLMHVGIGWWAMNLWVLYTVLPTLAVIQFGVILPEERYLEEKFGDVYRGYKKTVRRWL